MDMRSDNSQLDLFGRRPARESKGGADHRYYFTLLPPPAVAQDIEDKARPWARRAGSRHPTRAGRLHITLNQLHGGGPLDQDDIDDALAVGASIRRTAFDVTFDRVQTFAKGTAANRFPIVLSSSQENRDLERLYLDLHRAMQCHGMSTGPRVVTPHLTVLYAQEQMPDILLNRSFRWRVRHFWLVHTVPGLSAPEILGEWRLDGLAA